MNKFLTMYFQAGIGRAFMSDDFKSPAPHQTQRDSEFRFDRNGFGFDLPMINTLKRNLFWYCNISGIFHCIFCGRMSHCFNAYKFTLAELSIEDVGLEKITVKMLSLPFLFLVIGLTLAFIVFLVEVFCTKGWHKNTSSVNAQQDKSKNML